MSEAAAILNMQCSEDQAKLATAGRVIDKGRYRGQFVKMVEDWNIEEREYFDKEETKKNPEYGLPVARAQFSLTAKREGGKKDGSWESIDKPISYTVNLCEGVAYRGQDMLTDGSKAWGMIKDALKKAGKVTSTSSLGEIAEVMQDSAIEFNIEKYEGGVSKSSGKAYAPGNRLYSVSVA